jgi:4-methylaminobutanoate oxidase (formaldehyde-forming)
MNVREIELAGHAVRALRVTYVGELGWELHIPREAAGSCYEAILAAGRAFGLAQAGYRAIESLRLEKGYRAWSSDLTPSTTPLEAGLGFAVKLSGDRAFLGRTALEAQRREGLLRRLATFTVADPAVSLFGRETILRDGEPVGWLTSAGFGHTVGCGIGLGYVASEKPISASFVREGRYELEVATRRIPAQVHMRPLYDPEMARVKG